jgi:PAS domain S-box-containing protein
MDTLLDTMPCGYAAYLDDGTLVEVNSTLAQLLGYTRTELLGWHVQKLLPAGARIFQQTHVFPMLKMHGHADELFITLQAKDGPTLPMLMNAVRREREGVFVSECIFVRMTQRNEYEEQLIEARRVAEQANAAKAKFLSMMSHDLRTPLSAISGYATLLSRGMQGPLNPEQLDSIERITAASGDLLRLINDILSFAQLDSGRVEVQLRNVNVADAIARAERLIRLRLEEEGLTFSSEGCSELDVLADADRLQQVLLNLLTNAIKFTPRDGAIAIRCERIDDDRVRIHVRDTGVGITAEQLQSIFEPFVQVNSTSVAQVDRGVGLGLAIGRELMRAMNGTLDVESTPGEGSTFTIELRVAPAR